MDLNFEIFMIVLLVLSIVVVGNFLRDGESNYLEGALLMVSPLSPLRQSEANHNPDNLRYHRRCLVVLSQSRCSNIKRSGEPPEHLTGLRGTRDLSVNISAIFDQRLGPGDGLHNDDYIGRRTSREGSREHHQVYLPGICIS